MIEMSDTSAAAIAAEFVRARIQSGSPVRGMVMTVLIVVSQDQSAQAIAAAQQATHEHPCRILVLICGTRRASNKIDAEVGLGTNGWAGEMALIRLQGPVVDHADSVVTPLLLPDTPVVAWWPCDPPKKPGDDQLGRLAQRRITDAAASRRSQSATLRRQCRDYEAGNTDLAWARTTPWRALLAASLDHPHGKVLCCEVSADATSPSALLLIGWLSMSLGVPVKRHTSSGDGITGAVITTSAGDISIQRTDSDTMAEYTVPGRDGVLVALKRRSVAECLAEELRRLDEDEIYRDTVKVVGRTS
ncbi:MAG: glucose-6-phosphate dehydrogenase assembly protein OpcA [Nocardioidaceae bacterium]